MLQGIKDPTAQAAKQMVLASSQLQSNFDAAVTHLATSLQLSTTLQDNRNISAVGSKIHNGRGASHGGRGIRGGHQQAGGRGRGRNNNGRGGGRGRNIYLGTYTPSQWLSLSAEDKQRVIEGRKRSAEAASGAPTPTHNISQVVTSDDAVSAITMSVANAETPRTAQDTRASAEAAGSSMTRRRLMPIVTNQRTRSVQQVSQQRDEIIHSTCELDSHADTCVAGPNCKIIEHTGYTVNVTGYSKRQGILENVPIVKAATAYDNPQTGETFILILGQALYLGEHVESTLLCPNQL